MKIVLTPIFIFLVLISNGQNPEHYSKNKKQKLDSLKYFSILPTYFNENYKGSKLGIKNKYYMENCLKQISKKDIPYLIEIIPDTTKTQTVYADVATLRKADIALNLLTLVDQKLNLQQIVEDEFKKEKDPVINYDPEQVFITLLFKENQYSSVNYENRLRLYRALKDFYGLSKN